MASSTFSDERLLRRALRWPRITWISALASAVSLFALPLQLQAIYETRAWPSGYDVSQVSPGAVLHSPFWIRKIAACCVSLVLAAVVPRWLHVRWLARLNLPVVEGPLDPVASYRSSGERRFLVRASGVRAIVVAYSARLAAVLALLMPAIVRGYGVALPLRSFGSAMTPAIEFSSPEEYLPVFIAAVVILLLNAPTERMLLGAHAAAFRAGFEVGPRPVRAL